MVIRDEQDKAGAESSSGRKEGNTQRHVVEFVLKTSDAAGGAAELNGEKTR
jgi:hypothetical protein